MEKKKPITFSYLASCGVEFFSAVAVGAFLGLSLDRYFDKFPLFFITFFIFGSVSGYFNVMKYAKNAESEKDKENLEKN